VLEPSVPHPKAVLLIPVVFEKSAWCPTEVFCDPVVLDPSGLH
jgi:hypothetical protein